MFSMFFFCVGCGIGWWLRGTKAGTWLGKQFRPDHTE